MNEVKEQVKKIGDHNNRREFNKLVRIMQGGERPPTYRMLQGGARYSTGEEVRVGDVVRISVLDRRDVGRPGAGLPDDFDIDLSDPFLVIGTSSGNVAIRTIRNRSSQEVRTVGYSGSNLEFLTRSQPKFEIGDIVQFEGWRLTPSRHGIIEGEIWAGPRWRDRSFRGGPNLRWEYSVHVPGLSEENYYLAEDELREITTTSSSSGTSSSTNGSNSSSTTTTTTTTLRRNETMNQIVDLTNDIADELENSSSTTTTTRRRKKKKKSSDGKSPFDFMAEQFAKQINELQRMYYTNKTKEKTHILWKYDKDDSSLVVNNNVNDINYNETIVEFSKNLFKGDIMEYLGDLMEHMNLYLIQICGNLLTGGDYESLESIRGKIEDGFLKDLREKTKREKQEKLANDLEKRKKENEEKNKEMKKRKREEEEEQNKARDDRMKKQRQAFLDRFK